MPKGLSLGKRDKVKHRACLNSRRETEPALKLEENKTVYREEIARIHKSFPHNDLNFLVKIVGALRVERGDL